MRCRGTPSFSRNCRGELQNGSGCCQSGGWGGGDIVRRKENFVARVSAEDIGSAQAASWPGKFRCRPGWAADRAAALAARGPFSAHRNAPGGKAAGFVHKPEDT